VLGTAGDGTSERGSKAETDGGVAGPYELVTDDDRQQFQCSTSTIDTTVHHHPLTLFIAAANKPTSSGPPPASAAAATAGNPIDKLYSMQTSYFTAN